MSKTSTVGTHGSKRPVGRVLGVVLAGGQSRRMGADKGSIPFRGKPLIAHAIARLAPQVDVLVVNANGDAARYAGLGVPVIADTLAGHPGPLAGLLAAMHWAHERIPDATHVATVAVDTPFFPIDLVARLRASLDADENARLAFATTPQGPQPVFALVDIGLTEALERDIITGQARRVTDWLGSHAHAEVAFEDADAFFNMNTPADLVAAEALPQFMGTAR